MKLDESNFITKVGLAFIRGGCILLVRKRGSIKFILPGGRSESAENDYQTLSRELTEELQCEVDISSLKYVGEFIDLAANEPNKTVKVRLYIGRIYGPPVPSSEIEEMKWFSPDEDDASILADSIRNKILPYLRLSNVL